MNESAVLLLSVPVSFALGWWSGVIGVPWLVDHHLFPFPACLLRRLRGAPPRR